jgi:VanZ family protein
MRQRILMNWIQDFGNIAVPACRLRIAGVFFALMVMAGAIPGEAHALSAIFGDKALHFCAYALLSLLIFTGSPGSTWSRAVRTVLLIAVLGATDEAIQGFMPYRNADFLDWAWDMLASCWSVASLLALDAVGVRIDNEPDRDPIPD